MTNQDTIRVFKNTQLFARWVNLRRQDDSYSYQKKLINALTSGDEVAQMLRLDPSFLHELNVLDVETLKARVFGVGELIEQSNEEKEFWETMECAVDENR
jgi:dTDP-4-dehydrorhamnose 3,5-epimerase-like enzyme